MNISPSHRESLEPVLQIFSEVAKRRAEAQASRSITSSKLRRYDLAALELKSLMRCAAELSARMQCLIATRQQALNALLPIYQLPAEISIEIFDISLRLRSGNVHQTHQERLCTLRCVSAGWRMLIDNSPSLWTSVSCADPLRTVRDALLKSKNSPLEVIYNARFHQTSTMAKFTYLVLQHVHRWRTFDIVRLGNSQSVELLGIVAGSHAPELQELSISYTGGVRSTTDLFEGQSRQLRRVRLHSTLFLSWNSVLFSNLHTLHLSNLGRRGPSMHQVNSILQASPALVELKLESFFSESSVEPSIERTGPIELLSLRKFTISGVSPSLATHILDSTRIPNCENIIIHIDASTKASYATNETFLHSARVIAEASDFAHVELGAVQFTLRCWKQNKAALEVRINGKGWEFKAAESLLQLLDTSSDLDVFIDTKMYRNSDSLAKILSLLPNLRSARTLRLSQRRPSRDDGSNALIGELGVRRRVNGDMRWPLPLLETLRVGSTSVDAEALLTTIRGRFEATSDPPSKLKSIELTKNLEGCFRELESTFGEGVASCYDPASDSGIEGHNWFDEDENDEENTDDE